MRNLVKIYHSKKSGENDYPRTLWSIADLDKKPLEDWIKEVAPEPDEYYPIVEYTGFEPLIDNQYLADLLKEELSDLLADVDMEVNEHFPSNGIVLTFGEDDEIGMNDLLSLIEFCKKHDLTFNMGSGYGATDRCGFLAYDSEVWTYTTITIITQKGE